MFLQNKIEDLSEEIVCRWYSITRGLPIQNKGVILTLQMLIKSKLLDQGVENLIADQLSYSAISKWADECSGLPANSPYVMDSLIKQIYNILK